MLSNTDDLSQIIFHPTLCVKRLPMSPYNSFEQKISNFLRTFPRLKGFVKFWYTLVNYLMNFQKPWMISNHNVVSVNKCVNASTFFGYYDLNIENSDGMTVYCITEHDTRQVPKKYDKVRVVVQDKNGSIQFSAETRAFNWQQGARQHWIDNDRIIFNDFEDGNYVSKIYNISDKITIVCPVPVQCVANGQYIYSIDYVRLSEMRPDYGYFAHDKNFHNINNGFAIVEFDIISTKLREIVSFKMLEGLIGSSEEQKLTKVNHLLLSPDHQKMVFLYREIIKGVRYDYLMVYDRARDITKHIKTGEIISHYCWINSRQLIAYMTDKHSKLGFYLIDVVADEIKYIEPLRKFGDGHPYFWGNKIYFDSYPDKSRMQHLYQYDILTGSVERLASFKQPFRYRGQSRCDLHPRLNSNGVIYFDSAHSGKRSLYKLELKKQ